MPYDKKKVPAVAKNWTEAEQGKCIEAANAVLKEGGTEESAVFACIRAAGKSEKKERSLSREVDDVRTAWLDSLSDKERNEAWVDEVLAASLIVAKDYGKEKYRIPWEKTESGYIFGTPQEVIVKYVPKGLPEMTHRPDAGVTIMQTKEGRRRWVGWVSNRYRDKDKPAEIISEAAHKEFVEHADRTKEYPELRLWHVPGSKVGQADWLDYADGFLLASGYFDKGKEAVADRITKAIEDGEFLAMSHGFYSLKEDKAAHIIEKYRTDEVSILPRGAEANPLTSFSTKAREAEAMSLTQKKKEYLLRFLNPEDVEAIEAQTTTLKEAADKAGIEYKEVSEGLDKIEPAEETEDKKAEVEAETKEGKFSVKALADALVAELHLSDLSDAITELREGQAKVKELTDKVTALEDSMKHVKESDDAKIAEILKPKAASAFSWYKGGYSASKSKETVLGDSAEDQKLKEAAPKPSAIGEFIAGAWK